MDQASHSLLNVVLSVLAPVLILENCSTDGSALWELGTTWAMALALSLPIGCGLYSLVKRGKIDSLTLFGLLGTLLTGVITIYAHTGDGAALRPDTPWWYAAKEALIALLLCGAVLVTARREDSMLRTFVYSDALFDIPAIEKAVEHSGRQEAYQSTLLTASRMTAASLLFSALANFLLALYFLLPVLEQPVAEQAVAYNYAVGRMTWWGYLVIGVPLMATLLGVVLYLRRALQPLTGLGKEQLFLR